MLHLVIAVVWAAPAMRGSDLTVGLIIGYLGLRVLTPLTGPSTYVEKLPRAVGFAGLLTWDLILSSLRVAYDVVTPAANRRVAVVRVPLEARTDLEIGLFSLLVTVTPGSMVCMLILEGDARVAYVHAMFVEDPGEFAWQMRDIERRVLELTR